MLNRLTHFLFFLRNKGTNFALLTLTALLLILAPESAIAQTTPTFGTTTMPDTTYTVNTAVSDTLPVATGGAGTLTYTLTPALPAGLTYNAVTSGNGGVISGTPTTAAPATTYTLTATDANNATTTLTFTLSVTLSSDATLSRLTFYSVEQSASGAGGQAGGASGQAGGASGQAGGASGQAGGASGQAGGASGQAGSSDANLREIQIGDFSYDQLTIFRSFRFTVAAKVTFLTVKPTTNDSTATYTITPPDSRRMAGHQVDLNPGPNTITITVTATNGSTLQDYAITVTRKTPIDYDADNNGAGDGLIDVKNLAQLNAIRYDLDGDGQVDRPNDANAYALAFPDIGTNMGCRNNRCSGYELLNDLDFDTNGDGLITVADSTYFFKIGSKDSTGFVPIGRSGFKATFKGNGHTISNLYIKRGTPHVSVGLFNNVGADSIRGEYKIGRIEGVGLINAQVTGYNTGNNYVGPVGALVGSNEGGIVVNSYVTGTDSTNSTVSGSLQVGGLVGSNSSNGRVIASYSTASVTGSSDVNASVGALVGLNHSTIQASYAIGKVSGRRQGLVGRSSGRGASITYSYYDSETTGWDQGGTGAKTTAQLQAPTAYNSTLGNDQTAIYSAWNVNVDSSSTTPNNSQDNPWSFGESNQYPVLRYAGHDTTAQFAAQPDKTPNFGTATVRDTTFLANNQVSMTLPAALATSGNGKLIYALIDPPLPSELTFNNMTRVISGTPTTAVPVPASTYRMSVSDWDNNTKASDTDTLTFNIAVRILVTIPDDSLRAVITDSLGKVRNASITNDEMLDLTRLDAPNKGITNLTGLEFATNLNSLDLGDERVNDNYVNSNDITDISALSGLTRLTSLDLGGNRITAIDSLARLTSLTYLDLGNNRITAIDSLARLTRLTTLNLRGNSIADISSLSGLTSPTHLYLENNRITAIDPLRVTGLTSLISLSLHNNRISDLSPLVYNTGLGQEHRANVLLDGNPLSIKSRTTYIDSLRIETRKVTVVFDSIAAAELVEVSGDGQIGIPGRALANPFVVKVKRKDSEHPYRNLPVTFSVTAGGGSLNGRHSTINDTTDSNGQARALLTLGATAGTDTVKAFVVGPSDTLTQIFTTVSNGPVTIPDDGLRAVILDSLDMASNDTITVRDMRSLTRLDAPNKGITNLTGLEFATNLYRMDLGYEIYPVNSNAISDLSPLAGLTNLTMLQLGGNSISSIDTLASLTNLTYLGLSVNSITDISALSGLTSLTQLYLSFNSISDISALRGLTSLTYMNLSGNNLTDISSLSDLTNLTGLNLGRNRITDISSLQTLTSLTRLRLYDNRISDISSLSGLTSLTVLNLWNNSISDISALRGLTRLTELYLGGNDIPDISVLSNLTRLTELYLGRSKISDISSLSGLTKLTFLNLWSNSLTDISSLSGLTKLTTLNLQWNSIIDIAPLSGLDSLKTLRLDHNRISNLLPLVNNTELGSGDQVDVRGNPLSALSRTSYIPTLTGTGRSVTVSFDTLSVARLVKVSGDGQIGIAGTALDSSFVVKVQSRNDTTYAYNNLPVTFSVAAGGGSLSATSDTTDYNGLARTRLTRGATAGTDTVKAFVAGASDTLIFTTVSNGPVTIPDDSLRAVILDSLDMASNDTITVSNMKQLTRLDAPNKGIKNLTGLEFAVNLDTLELGGARGVNGDPVNKNEISDLTPLKGLSKLRRLNLFDNGKKLTNISALSGLDSLRSLDLRGNGISDISFLANLTNLTYLGLARNPVSNISPLSGLTKLGNLNLQWIGDDDDFSNISHLRGLTSLGALSLTGNSISDISHLSYLTNLAWLALGGNRISDISDLSNLRNLRWLHLNSNSIMDISSLSGLDSLITLSLGGNHIAVIDSLANLTNLTKLDLGANRISDLSPLVSNSGLGSGDRVGVRGNPLSVASRTHIDTLISRGVTVEFDDLTGASLVKLSGDRQTGIAGTALDSSFVVRVSKNNATLSGIPVIFSVTAGGGSLDTTFVRTGEDGPGLAAARLTLGLTAGTDTVQAFVAGLDTVIFTATVLPLTSAVTIPDDSLRAVILDSLHSRGLARNDTITAGDMQQLTHLFAWNKGIKNLTGLEFAINLNILELGWERVNGNYVNSNEISDLRPLKGLSKLRGLDLDDNGNKLTHLSALSGLDSLIYLDIRSNGISDISFLEDLTNLTYLHLARNPISDISPLGNLTKLRGLNLQWIGNGFSDISPLQNLTSLANLTLGGNSISDISPLSRLINLTRLQLWNNSITDLSPLVSNSGLGSGDRVNVGGNPLSVASRTHIDTLISRGVTVEFDDLTGASLVKLSGDRQTGIAGTALDTPFVVRVSKNNAALSGIPVLFSVTAGGGSLDTTFVRTSSGWSGRTPGLAAARLTLGLTAGTDTVKAFVTGLDTVIFTATVLPLTSAVTIPDDSLRAVILDSLDMASNDTITAGDMRSLTRLDARNKDIKNLTGLEFATNLEVLNFGYEVVNGNYVNKNAILDITPLKGLSKLTRLNLGDNKITNILSLSGLTNLTWLYLGGNTITDISSLSGLTNLTWLYLGGNTITDISSLSGLTNLTSLNLAGSGNTITDISSLSGLTKLTHLRLWGSGNTIADISSLSGLTELTMLKLWGPGNSISDISPLSGSTKLTWLDISGTGNSISDISSLSGLTKLTTLKLGGNSISVIDSLANLTNLTELYLDWNSIIDIAPLSGLDSLKTLRLNHNRIFNLSPLRLNTGLERGDRVNVRGNPLSALSRTSYIPALTGRSVTVLFDTLSVARLKKVSGDGQIGKAGAALANPFVVKVQSKNDATYPYRNLPVTFSVTAGGGSLSATSDTTDYNGLARTRLTRGATSSGYTVKAFVEGASDTLIFTTLSLKPATIPDDSLHAAILDSLHSLGMASNDTITVSDMLHLTRLDAPNKGIRTLTGLEFAINLDTLDLRNNRITTIDSLGRLTHLKKLSLGGNGISDIASLARLTNLTWLWLSYNAISDIDSLANLTDLTWLGLGDNRISDISSLSGLTNLTRLGLSNNRITDLSPLVNNANNEGLGSGDKVDVRGNPLSAASRTSYIPTLTNNKSVTVSFDTLSVARLEKVSGDGQIGTVGTVLAKPFVVKVQDQNRRGYAGLPVAFSVTAGGGALSTNTDTTDATGQAETTLKLGVTASTHTVLVSVEGLSQTLTFTATLPTPDFDGNGQVNFADFMALANKIGPGQGRGSYEVKYDLDGDGIVGMGDFEVFMARFSDSKFDAAK